jgi:hypothetical protein
MGIVVTLEASPTGKEGTLRLPQGQSRMAVYPNTNE